MSFTKHHHINKLGQQIEGKPRPQHTAPLNKNLRLSEKSVRSACYSHSHGRPWPHWSARRSHGGLEQHSTNPRIHCNRRQERMWPLYTTCMKSNLLKYTYYKYPTIKKQSIICFNFIWAWLLFRKVASSKASMVKMKSSQTWELHTLFLSHPLGTNSRLQIN